MKNIDKVFYWLKRTGKLALIGALIGILIGLVISMCADHSLDGDHTLEQMAASSFGVGLLLGFIPTVFTVWFLFLHMLEQISKAVRNQD